MTDPPDPPDPPADQPDQLEPPADQPDQPDQLEPPADQPDRPGRSAGRSAVRSTTTAPPRDTGLAQPHGDTSVGPGLLPERTVMGVLGIEAVEATPDRVVLSVPVTYKVHQPYGILHGGVSALLAETAASYGGTLSAPPGHHVVGIELNASHLRPMRNGVLTATATPIRRGRAVQVWEVMLTDDQGRDICRARCTLAVIRSPGASPAASPEPSPATPRRASPEPSPADAPERAPGDAT